jgi:hypothetical protein
MKEALKLGKFKSKEQAVNAALTEYVQLQKRRALVALAGKITYRPDYDYKKLRALPSSGHANA